MARREADKTELALGPDRSPPGRLQGARVLVLDDESAVLESMRSLLENWGCNVDTAATLEAALPLVRERVPDLLIVDYRLAGPHSGLDAVGHLRNASGGEIPALVITGDTAPERLQEARDSGYPLLHKPVQPARLRSPMQHLLRQRVPEADADAPVQSL